jgi:hypothetical protein
LSDALDYNPFSSGAAIDHCPVGRLSGFASDHDDFGLNQSKVINVIGFQSLERDGTENRYPLFLIPPLRHAGSGRPAESGVNKAW